MGWLINPQDNQIEIYRKGQAVEILENPAQLSEVSGLKDLFEQIGEHKNRLYVLSWLCFSQRTGSPIGNSY